MYRCLLWLCATAIQAQELNLMTYNIRHGAGMDGKIDYDRTAAVIRGVNPDVVALQEVDSATQRCHGKYVGQELAARTNMIPTFGAAINYQGGKYGVGILSRVQPLAVRRIPLPGREEPRMLLIAEFANYIVCSTHLSLTAEDLAESATIICNEMKRLPRKPIFLMGDFNAEPDSPLLQTLSKKFHVLNKAEEHTIPADKPEDTIDFIMAWKKGKKVTVKDVGVVNAPMASDHLPVRASVKW